jgi:hypothetical protein
MAKRIILGAGQCGMKLASEFFHTYNKTADSLINLSTSSEDSVNIPKTGLVQVAREGSGKKFSHGESLWRNNQSVLNTKLATVRGADVIYFASAGGGSGSSSIRYVSDILLKNDNRIFLVLVLPFDYENLPYKPNALQTLSRLQDDGYTSMMSVLLFDNEQLAKRYVDVEVVDGEREIKRPNLEQINNHIISTTSIVLDLVRRYHIQNKYTPFSIDELEHESVVFSKGFIGVDFKNYDDGPANVKFDYGKISDCKNVVLAKAVRLKETDYLIDQSTGRFLDVVRKLSKKAKNARVMSGIIRTNEIDDGTFVVIGNNLDVAKYINKTKTRVGANIEQFRQQSEREKIFNSEEASVYDI